MYNKIDYTLLKATATIDDIDVLCKEAIEKGYASVCIPSCYVEYVSNEYPELRVCTVVGFPLGNSSTETKIEETRQAIIAGAHEIDAVINIGALKAGLYGYVKDELQRLKRICGKHTVLKIIIETCYLTREEKIIMCRMIQNLRIDFVKTSTGFGTGGATIEDVKLMRAVCGDDVKIKASGGIRTKEEAEEYLKYCDRLGMSKLP